MTDRELLELAAKAAGIEVTECTCSAKQLKATHVRDYATHWNPLTDDGDALRLAVKLGLQYTTILEIGIGGTDCVLNRTQLYAHERHDGGADPYASTRRAIVRAAAQIGEAQC